MTYTYLKEVLLLLIFFFGLIINAQNLVPGGIDAGADRTLDCTTGPCTTLTADFHESHQTDARYTVNSIAMDPVAVTLPSNLAVDDGYSQVVDLGFTFCYFGEEKTQIQIGDNGTVSFKIDYTPLTAFVAQYTVPADCPSNQLPLDAVFGAYHDLLQPAGGQITYGITGTAPFRAFVINYRAVAHYNCNSIQTFQQIVLHETSNFIDVYITDKPACTSWQGGAAIVGIQNADGSEGYTAPGRNMSDSPWTASNEAWRFAPTETGAETFTLEWVNNTTGLVESNDVNYDICPSETTTYSANVTWVDCTGGTVSATDEVTITVDLPFTLAIDGGDQNFCDGDPAYNITTTATIIGAVTVDSYNWYEASDPSTSLGTTDNLTLSTTGTYVVEATDSGGCVVTQQVNITYNPVPDAGTGGAISVCSTDGTFDMFGLIGGTPDTGGTWSPALASGTNIFNPAVDSGGTYTYSLDGMGCPDATSDVIVTLDIAPDAGGSATEAFCSTDASLDLFTSLTGTPGTGGTWSPALTSGTGVFDPGVDAAGVYTYAILGTGTCADASATVTVSVDIAPNAGTNGTAAFCSTDTATDLFTSLGGTPDGGGTWSPALTSGTGVFDPAVDTAGTYTYIVTGGGCPDDTATIDVTVDIAPNAGTNGAADICATDATFDLYTSLGGTPDSGGSWSPALTSGTGVFDPMVDVGGVYTYTVLASGVCPADATATITVTLNTAPNAGVDGAINYCSTDAATDLYASLTGTPDLGGTWSPALTSGTGIFDPALDVAGVYTYTVTGLGACADDTSVVTVSIDVAPDAGTNGTIDLCTDNTTVDLFTSLGGTPDAGGTWSPALTSGTGIFDPEVDVGGVYTYTVLAIGACTVDATASVTVNLTIAPEAGLDGAIMYCSTDAASDLFLELGGAPDGGGTWLPALTSGTGVFDPAVDSAGVYTYTVAGSGACVDDTATVTVGVDMAPNSGTDGLIELCTNNASVDLFTSLGGTPDSGGTWSPALTSGTGVFDPAVDTSGIYTYTTSNGVCVDDTATVTVTVYTAANAGGDNTITLCSVDAPIDLFASLGGMPDTGGTWLPALTSGTGIFDPTVDTPGVYTYTIIGTGVCVDDNATVEVFIDTNPDAGIGSSVEFCSTDSTLDLFTLLVGTPDSGGTWSPALASGTGVFNPAIDTGAIYTYTVSNGVCTDATAQVDVTLYQAPDAGINGNVSLCTSDLATDLFTVLGGTPDAGGTWFPALASGTGLFDPLVDTAGIYRYTVLGTGTCIDVFADVEVLVDIAPNAGENADAFFCMSDIPTDLLTLIGGTPDIGGSWSPALASGTGVFNPAVDPAGDYTYTVLGVGACKDISSVVSVTLSEAPRITNVTVNDFSDNNIVTVEVEGVVSGTPFGMGDYEYSLDGISFQSENIFENVAPGNYTLEVQDTNGCRPNAYYPVSVMGAPKFFTPNNDSYNDTWHIINLNTSSLDDPTSGVTIYDRYGKIVKVLYANEPGWNGVYNGEAMPSTDYWYSVAILDSSGNTVIKRGHFSLIRR